jgi:hypothetical protein
MLLQFHDHKALLQLQPLLCRSSTEADGNQPDKDPFSPAVDSSLHIVSAIV